jgi:hypothetical protein
MRGTRVLFVGRSIGHISYYQSILEFLLARGAKVELVFDKKWSKSGVADMSVIESFAQAHPDLTVGWLVRRADRMRSFAFALRELRSYQSYLTRRHTTQFYVDRWQKYLTPRLRVLSDQAAFRRLLAMNISEAVLRLLERLIPSDQGIVEFIQTRRPDVVVLSPLNMRFSEETDYLKAAKKLGILTLLPVYSWDNLSTKGLIQILPDLVCVWNDYQRGDALEIQRVPPDSLRVGGAPFFDKWFQATEASVSREEFFEFLGFDAAKPLLLYLGSSKNIAKDESWFVEAVKDHLEGSDNPTLRGTQILVRPHPANAEIYRRLSRAGMRVWPENGALPASPEEFARMRDSFLYANAALGINTSGMIDSVLAGLPTFTVRLDEYSKTQAETLHFRYLEEADAMSSVVTLEEFATEFMALISGDDKKQEKRRAFAQRFARPLGLNRPAGDVIAEAIIDLALTGRKQTSIFPREG